MASASFTRDEVILALDVLYSLGKQRISSDSEEMADLSALLNRLPIHSVENRRADFRNTTGITRQINLLRTSLHTGRRDPNVGVMFIDIAFEFENRHDELHQIAESIRRNEKYYSAEFGGRIEEFGFPEGILLGHLHSIMEVRYGAKISLADHCEICDLKPELYYQSCENLLQPHLLIPPAELDGGKKYGTEHFITVCPNCHAALHRSRPWRTKEDCGTILR